MTRPHTFKEILMLRSALPAFLLITFLSLASTAKAFVTLHPMESPNEDFRVVVAIGPMSDVGFALFYKGELLVEGWRHVFSVDENDALPATASFIHRNIQADGQTVRQSKYVPSSIGAGLVKSVRLSFQEQTVNDGNMDYNEFAVQYDRIKEGRKNIDVLQLTSEDREDIVKIIFRVYNEGFAYRYEITTKEGEAVTIKNELIEFDFPDDYAAGDSTLSKISKETPSPLLITIPDKPAFSFGEVSQSGFAALQFQPGPERMGTFSNLFDHEHGTINREGKRTALALNLAGETVVPGTGGTYRTPWRYLKIAEPQQGGMLQSLSTRE